MNNDQQIYGLDKWDVEHLSRGRLLEVKYKRLTSSAVTPFREYSSAGYDLYADENVILEGVRSYPYIDSEGKQQYMVHIDNKRIGTGIALEFDENYVARCSDTSGLGHKNIKVLGGVCDADYRGEYKVSLANLSNQDFEIKKGTKLCQILFLPVEHPILIECEDLSPTQRGNKGWGSTTKN